MATCKRKITEKAPSTKICDVVDKLQANNID